MTTASSEHLFESPAAAPATPLPTDGADLMDPNMRSNRHLAYAPLGSLTPHPRNPKAHDLPTLDASVARFGFTEPVIVDERTGYLISGHGRRATLEAMHSRGDSPPEGIRVDDDGTWLVPTVRGWASRSDSEATAALIALNRTTELGGWVDEDLLSLLDGLADDDDPSALAGVGYGPTDIDDLRARLADLGDEADDGPERASAGDVGHQIEAVDVLWGEPRHEVHHRDVWRLGRHLLVVARLADEHERWAPSLTGRVFCPYPEPYITLGTRARDNDLLLVQPVTYLAGHLLDKHASVYPDEVALVSRGDEEAPADQDADALDPTPEPAAEDAL